MSLKKSKIAFPFSEPGPTSTEVARIKAPSSIRAQFGTDCTRNACHGSDSHESARLVMDYFDFDVEIRYCASIPYSPRSLDIVFGSVIRITYLLFYFILSTIRTISWQIRRGLDSLYPSCEPEKLTSWISVYSQEVCFFFINRKLGTCARFCNCSVAIIKPHAMMAGDDLLWLSPLAQRTN